ncbi:hypothetical protein ACFVIM_34050 [Streptomyces sp. NPDC057638]|uniref:hypothetical protein n=1 Tax=Streptomyces sp. NPDC057638 TaxID=3346190 RepID=UPI0036CC122F
MSAESVPLPDPYADPAGHLHAHRRRLQRAETDMAGAFLYDAAPALRLVWPTAARVVFDRADRHQLHPLTFRRIEDARGATVVGVEGAEALDGDPAELWCIALHEILAAVRHWNAGAVPGDRPWRIDLRHSSEGERPPYLCIVTLPPVHPPGLTGPARVRPQG